MTNYQAMMRHLVEQAGECWHSEGDIPSMFDGNCVKCGIYMAASCNANPSPTDLNELVRLAEKLGYDAMLIRKTGRGWHITLRGTKTPIFKTEADTPAIALLTALCKATNYNERSNE